jgi:hypothetical protein
MKAVFEYKGHQVEISPDVTYALTYIVLVDGEYVGDCHRPMNETIDQVKSYITTNLKGEAQ